MSAGRAALALVVAIAACASGPPAPDWQGNAKGAIERSVAAQLRFDHRVADLEFARARGETARSGRFDLVARIELMRCAARVASLQFEPCAGFDAIRDQAGDAERAYADYLAGQPLPAAAIALLPAAQQTGAASGGGAALKSIEDPLARLVAIGVRLRTNRIDPAAIELAVETASEQGWVLPLTAWLTVQLKRAEAAGAGDDVTRLKKRIELVTVRAATS